MSYDITENADLARKNGMTEGTEKQLAFAAVIIQNINIEGLYGAQAVCMEVLDRKAPEIAKKVADDNFEHFGEDDEAESLMNVATREAISAI